MKIDSTTGKVNSPTSMKTKEKSGIVDMRSPSLRNKVVNMENTVSVRTGKNVHAQLKLSKSIMPSSRKSIKNEENSIESTENVNISDIDNETDKATSRVKPYSSKQVKLKENSIESTENVNISAIDNETEKATSRVKPYSSKQVKLKEKSKETSENANLSAINDDALVDKISDMKTCSCKLDKKEEIRKESSDNVNLSDPENQTGDARWLRKSNMEPCSSKHVKLEENTKDIIENVKETNADINQANAVTINAKTTTLFKKSNGEFSSDIMSGEWISDVPVSEVVSQTDIQSQNIKTLTQSPISGNETVESKTEGSKKEIYRLPDKLGMRYLMDKREENFSIKKSKTRKNSKSSLMRQWKKRKKSSKLKRKLKDEEPEKKYAYKRKYFEKKNLKANGWSWNYEENLKEKYISDDINADLEKCYKQSKNITMILRDLTELLYHERSWNVSGYVYPTRRGKQNKGNRRSQQARTHQSQAAEGVKERCSTQVSDADNENLDLPSADLVVTSSRPTFNMYSSNVPSPTPSSMVSIDSERNLRTRLHGQLPDSRFSRLQEPSKHPEYSDQPSRQRSFTNWPATTGQDPSRMAVYGFFYTGRLDLIRCYMCGIGLKDWAGADEPLFEHIKHSPDCTFLKDLLGEELLSAYRDNLRANQIQQASNPVTTSAGNAAEASGRARNPQYREVQARLNTFDKWPSSAKQRPRTLADAGLYFTGTTDLCRCFMCDGGLQRWDVDDDPWIEHARWFPNCQFVRQVKGQEYINMVQEAAAQARAEEEGQATANPVSGQGARRNGPVEEGMAGLNLEDNSPLNTSAARVVIGMGYSRRAVLLAVQEFKHQAPVGGQNDFSSGDLTRILREMERRGEDLPPDSPNDSQMGATAAVVFPENSDPEEENRRLRGILRCMLCRQNDTNILFLPCTHHRLCEDCAQKIVICPVCGKTISEKIKTYLS